MAERLTHLDEDGRARMVDVGDKLETQRTAVAAGAVSMCKATLDLARAGNTKKGDVRSVSEIAGIMAAKRTADLIPLCHPLPLSDIKVSVETDSVSSLYTLVLEGPWAAIVPDRWHWAYPHSAELHTTRLVDPIVEVPILLARLKSEPVSPLLAALEATAMSLVAERTDPPPAPRGEAGLGVST